MQKYITLSFIGNKQDFLLQFSTNFFTIDFVLLIEFGLGGY